MIKHGKPTLCFTVNSLKETVSGNRSVWCEDRYFNNTFYQCNLWKCGLKWNKNWQLHYPDFVTGCYFRFWIPQPVELEGHILQFYLRMEFNMLHVVYYVHRNFWRGLILCFYFVCFKPVRGVVCNLCFYVYSHGDISILNIKLFFEL